MTNTTRADLSIDGSLATVTITTEGGLNIMSPAAIRQFGDVIDKVRDADGIRMTIIRAEGKVFVAGADIKQMSRFDQAAALEFGQAGSRVCDAIESLPCITVALIQGAAMGGGCEIALACDFRIASANVKIGLPETTLGLIPGWGGILRSTKLLGRSVAMRMVFGGKPLSADDAKTAGLIDQVVPSVDAMDAAVADLRVSLVKGSPAAIALVKRVLQDGRDVDAFAECFTNDESREGMAAFAEKRAAAWAQG